TSRRAKPPVPSAHKIQRNFTAEPKQNKSLPKSTHHVGQSHFYPHRFNLSHFGADFALPSCKDALASACTGGSGLWWSTEMSSTFFSSLTCPGECGVSGCAWLWWCRM